MEGYGLLMLMLTEDRRLNSRRKNETMGMVLIVVFSGVPALKQNMHIARVASNALDKILKYAVCNITEHYIMFSETFKYQGQVTTSAQMNPFSKSVWIVPAA